MSTLRVTINAPDAETATEVKEQYFKQLYEHAGTKVVFELPLGADDEADAMIAFGKEKGCEGEKEVYDDPLDEAAGVDFW